MALLLETQQHFTFAGKSKHRIKDFARAFQWALFSPPQDIVRDYQRLQHLSNWQEAVQAQMEVSQLEPS